MATPGMRLRDSEVDRLRDAAEASMQDTIVKLARVLTPDGAGGNTESFVGGSATLTPCTIMAAGIQGLAVEQLLSGRVDSADVIIVVTPYNRGGRPQDRFQHTTRGTFEIVSVATSTFAIVAKHVCKRCIAGT